MICLIVLVFTLGVVAGNEETTLTADCSGDVVLPCFAFQRCRKYTSVGWYKLNLIIIKSENVFQNDKLDKNASLILRKVAPEDSGIYTCFIWGRAGEMNCQTHIRLNISDCASTFTPITDFSTDFTYRSSPNISIPMTRVDNNSELYVIWVYLGLAVIKIVLCLFCIWVFKAISRCRG